MNSITGTITCLFSIAMGIFMIAKANKCIKKTKLS
jgi:hypothetical protein